jgi:hypothetical protein
VCGALLQGWLAEQLGVRQSRAATGALALLATAAVGIALLRARHGTDPLEHDPVEHHPVEHDPLARPAHLRGTLTR